MNDIKEDIRVFLTPKEMELIIKAIDFYIEERRSASDEERLRYEMTKNLLLDKVKKST